MIISQAPRALQRQLRRATKHAMSKGWTHPELVTAVLDVGGNAKGDSDLEMLSSLSKKVTGYEMALVLAARGGSERDFLSFCVDAQDADVQRMPDLSDSLPPSLRESVERSVEEIMMEAR
ncbi:hypothetical protein [Pseudoxanthomonas sp. SORGH_AS_0997]|uniref:hypothetical protein n=1 Tax=Pseudoxanthomonas sp. SORGH_AS_0997 TaxID=3041776 RepID=UPI00286B485F|nr:hypothetical protein [Pseudoxanthomonas sp. SORGH_AS_0997]